MPCCLPSVVTESKYANRHRSLPAWLFAMEPISPMKSVAKFTFWKGTSSRSPLQRITNFKLSFNKHFLMRETQKNGVYYTWLRIATARTDENITKFKFKIIKCEVLHICECACVLSVSECNIGLCVHAWVRECRRVWYVLWPLLYWESPKESIRKQTHVTCSFIVCALRMRVLICA